MKKQTSSNQVVLFVFIALVAGFLVGQLRPQQPKVVTLDESSVTKLTETLSLAVVGIVASNSPANGGSHMGSGFILFADGLVVTNRHVVDDPEANYTVILSDGRTFGVDKIKKDAINDLAVLKLLNATDLPTAKLADSNPLHVGQQVIAMGMNLSHQGAISRGVIQSIGRSIVAGAQQTTEELTNMIETDASIQPGSSGGPLFNLSGEVIGINTALDTTNGRISFAIPIGQLDGLIKS